MAITKSTKHTATHRGAKLEFGLHPSGQYRKKYKGKTLWLGDDTKKVLDQWLAKTEQIDEARKNGVVLDRNKMTIDALCNEFLHVKLSLVKNDELSEATYRNYKAYGDRIIAFFGRETLLRDLTDDDFRRFRDDLSQSKTTKKQLSLVGLKTKIRHVKVFFNYALKKKCIKQLPWLADTFTPPSQKAINKQKNTAAKKHGKRPKQATRDEIEAVLTHCDNTWRALILFALNTGSGNMDCGLLRWDDIDADGWVENPRSKTQVLRRFRLWPETRIALEAVREHYTTKGYTDGLVFHGRQGGNYVPKGKTNHTSRRFTELTVKAGVRRANLSFYSLRHSFQNIADSSLDFPAVVAIMGHAPTTMSDEYRGMPSDERLEAVTETVRRWFFDLDSDEKP